MSAAQTKAGKRNKKMRLICPNCGAQYEVPAEVIPPEGRDVQCSACSNTWFQAHPDHDRALSDELENVVPEPVAPNVQPVPDPDPEPADESQPSPPANAAPQAVRADQRRLDPNVTDVLREEAELERAARAAERTEPLESQPDLGLENSPTDDATQRANQAKVRMAKMRGEPVPTSVDAMAAGAANSRKDLLPDIDEINSTLRASGDRGRPAEASDADLPKTQPRKARRGGFRLSFYGIVLIAALGIAGYVYGPQIAEAVPQAEPYVAEYSGQVETARSWLSTSVDRGLRWLDQMASENL